VKERMDSLPPMHRLIDFLKFMIGAASPKLVRIAVVFAFASEMEEWESTVIRSF